jgi:two-component system response regulator HydG
MMGQAAATASLRILLVEDHWDIARVLVMMLKSMGHEAVAAPTVAEAVNQAKGGDFDLLISDYSLPDGTGIDVLEKLKPMGLSKAILITAYGKQFRQAAHAAGFARYLEKPVDPQTLATAIAETAGTPSS